VQAEAISAQSTRPSIFNLLMCTSRQLRQPLKAVHSKRFRPGIAFSRENALATVAGGTGLLPGNTGIRDLRTDTRVEPMTLPHSRCGRGAALYSSARHGTQKS
jgi:hypothetical protein